MASVVPRCLALVLCEHVRRDPRTGASSLVGAVDVIQVKSIPAKSSPFFVWLQVTNGNGPARMELVIERIPPRKLAVDVVLRAPFNLVFRDPNDLLEHVAVFDGGIALEWQGRYRLRLTANGTTVMQRYFVVIGAQ